MKSFWNRVKTNSRQTRLSRPLPRPPNYSLPSRAFRMATATTKSHFHGHHGEQAKQQRRPRPITEAERAAIEPFLEKVHYSPRYAKRGPLPPPRACLGALCVLCAVLT